MLKVIGKCLICISLLNLNALAKPTLTEPEVLTDIIDDVTFYKLGTYRGFTNDGAEYQKTYFFPRYSEAYWADSKAICKVYDFELATLESLQEANALLTMVENHDSIKPLAVIWLWIDGISMLPKTTTSWYWGKTGRKISFPIPWLAGFPSNTDQLCLSVGKSSQNQKFGFTNGYCSGKGYLRFICQRTEFYIP
ncbi:unnamed protein product [Chironomus riparius]|uniref:C-type lectin domain-containing protein n=1 Tax=Chironomus riparius TaxID=315576 RepID=A0A9N9WTB4_9DIPT|nr:unnamed protein product [Chironomus riparius]